MIFAHLSDCHIGSWREPALRNTSTQAFITACTDIIEQKAQFVIIAGDLFNTAAPGIDYVKETTQAMKKMHDEGIRIYVIAGSHDFSPSGKTMIDVLEKAGLVVNVAKGQGTTDGKLRLFFTVDQTGVKICGVPGRKGMLDKYYLEQLDLDSLQKEEGDKIFVFHTLLNEFKIADFELIDSVPLSSFPKGFRYYAGGHPHYPQQRTIETHGTIAYPGPLFPNNFRELEKLQNGGYYMVRNWRPEWRAVKLHEVYSITVDAEGINAKACEQAIIEALPQKLDNTIVTLRVEGKISEGRPADISWTRIYGEAMNANAICLLRNTIKLNFPEFLSIKSPHLSEDQLIHEHLSQQQSDLDEVKTVMTLFNKEKKDGERQLDYEERIFQDANRYFKDAKPFQMHDTAYQKSQTEQPDLVHEHQN